MSEEKVKVIPWEYGAKEASFADRRYFETANGFATAAAMSIPTIIAIVDADWAAVLE